jgi:hypothetical protein
MTIDPITASLIIAGVGAVSGIGGALTTTLITKRADERQHYRTLAIQAALAQWQFTTDIAKLLMQQGNTVELTRSFDVILIQKLKLMEMVAGERLDAKATALRIRELATFAETLAKDTTQKIDDKV